MVFYLTVHRKGLYDSNDRYTPENLFLQNIMGKKEGTVTIGELLHFIQLEKERGIS